MAKPWVRLFNEKKLNVNQGHNVKHQIALSLTGNMLAMFGYFPEIFIGATGSNYLKQ